MKIVVFYNENNIEEILEVYDIVEKYNEYILLHKDISGNILKEYINKNNTNIETIEGENK